MPWVRMDAIVFRLNHCDISAKSLPQDSKIIPGHTTFAPDQITIHTNPDTEKFAEAIEVTSNIVKQQIDTGSSPDDILPLYNLDFDKV